MKYLIHSILHSKAIPVISLVAISSITSVGYSKDVTNMPKVGMVQANKNRFVVNPSAQATQITPFPAHWKNLKQVKVVNDKDNTFIFNLISTDGDDKQYEEVEYIYTVDDEVLSRAIVKGVRFLDAAHNDGNNEVILEGIGLDKDNISDYTPKGIWDQVVRSDMLYKALDALTRNHSNNNAVGEVPKNVDYANSYYDVDLGS